ncbi:putative mitochondrial protein AtMg00310 [Castanea sativa]|uniref:putative mitochondrial protein AtMg00310 n=1 Tax=Castanea sativa TaxID=21020 RepID=UPI003F65346F
MGPMQDLKHNKFLGLPSIIGKSKSAVFADIKERVAKKLSSWKEKLISMGGREVLIKAVAQAIPTYTMSCFLLPKGLCDDIEGMMRRFWWGQRDQESKIAWVSWQKLCKSKLEGGIGFRNLQAFNLAMLAKQGWRPLSNPYSLIARIYKARYYPHGDVLNSKPQCNPSYAWRSIFQALEAIRKGT